MTDIPDLPDDQMSIIVFGPGFGESVLLRAPPGEWLVVDSLTEKQRRVSINPSIRLLAQYDAQPTAVLLTHPHADHAAGFDEYIDQWPQAMVGCLPFHLSSLRDRLSDPDAERALRSGQAEHALAAITDAWERAPDREWRVQLATQLAIGEAMATVIGPDDAVIEAATAGRNVDPNELSTPLVVEWQDVRVVLGADLPAREWERIAVRHPDIAAGEHAALKIPHHGSKNAQPSLLAESADRRDRRWVGTPWRLGRGTLPRFEDGEGMDLLLSRVGEVSLTALPFASASPPANAERRLPRQVINETLDRRRFGGDDMILTYEAPATTSDDAWVLLSYASTGELATWTSGAACTTVTP